MPSTTDPGKMYYPRISAPHSGTRGYGGYFYGPSNNPVRDIIELEYVLDEWKKQKPTTHMGLTEDKIKKHTDRIIKKIDQLKKGLRPEQTQQYHDALIEIQQEEVRMRESLERHQQSLERPRIPYGPVQVAMAEDIPERDRPYLRHRAQAEGRYAVNMPIIEPDIAESAPFVLEQFLRTTLQKVKASTSNNFNVSELFLNAVEQSLAEGNQRNLSLLRDIFSIIKEKTGDNYAEFRSNFPAEILQRLEESNIGRGLVLKQKLKGFEISSDGYGVEVDKLFMQITKKTLVDIMKQLGETQNEYALMKKSKSFLMHYFMKTYASDKQTGSKVVADNRPKKKEKFETVADKRFAMYQKERRQKGLEKMKQDRMQEALISKPVKLTRPAPVRRKKDVSL
jgi:hypothetical protein